MRTITLSDWIDGMNHQLQNAVSELPTARFDDGHAAGNAARVLMGARWNSLKQPTYNP